MQVVTKRLGQGEWFQSVVPVYLCLETQAYGRRNSSLISSTGKINKILYFFNKIMPVIPQLKMIKKIQKKKIEK